MPCYDYGYFCLDEIIIICCRFYLSPVFFSSLSPTPVSKKWLIGARLCGERWTNRCGNWSWVDKNKRESDKSKISSTMWSRIGKKFSVLSNPWQRSLLSQITNRVRVKSKLNSFMVWWLWFWLRPWPCPSASSLFAFTHYTFSHCVFLSI